MFLPGRCSAGKRIVISERDDEKVRGIEDRYQFDWVANVFLNVLDSSKLDRREGDAKFIKKDMFRVTTVAFGNLVHLIGTYY